MSPVLTITLDSADYVAADRALRVKASEYVPGASEHVCNIVRARRALGFSMHPRDMFVDYTEEDLLQTTHQQSEP